MLQEYSALILLVEYRFRLSLRNNKKKRRTPHVETTSISLSVGTSACNLVRENTSFVGLE